MATRDMTHGPADADGDAASASPGTAAGADATSVRWRVIAAAAIGNALEWFDIVVYGFFASTIATVFFPTGNPTLSLMLAMGGFGVTFVIRPLGAVVLGTYADRVGRKATLSLTIWMMMLGTAIIALLPGYASIGIAAPALLLLAKMIQGFSAGGEFGSATAFLAEQDPKRRGFYASWQFASQGLSMLLGAAFGWGLSRLLSPQQLQDWGWRIPFLFGLMIGPVAWYIRRRLDETPEFRQVVPGQGARDVQAVRKPWGRILIGAGMIVAATVALYLVMFMPTYAIRQLGVNASGSYAATMCAGAVLLILTPLAGLLVDRVGRMIVALPATALLAISVVPLFLGLARHPNVASLLVLQVVLSAITALYLGALPALLADLFPVQTRTTGLSLSYNLSVTLFGGFAPFIVTWMVSASGQPAAPAAYLLFAALTSAAALAYAKRRYAMH